MSTNKLLLIFGIVALAVTGALMVLYFGFPSILGRFIGLVENAIVGILGGVLVTVALALILSRIRQKATDKVARVAISEVSQVVNRLMDLFFGMVKAASDGFVPSTIDDLFGDKASGLISLHLQLDGHTGTTSTKVWIEYMALESEHLIATLSSLQGRYIPFLSEDIFAALTALRSNDLMNMWANCGNLYQFDKRSNIRRPVLNIPLDQLRPRMLEILGSVKTVEKEAVRLNARVIPRLSQFSLANNVEPKLGSARFDGAPGPSCTII